jgi:hypothetical protein
LPTDAEDREEAVSVLPTELCAPGVYVTDVNTDAQGVLVDPVPELGGEAQEGRILLVQPGDAVVAVSEGERM